METVHQYRASAEEAARGASPRYEEFALGVAEDRDVLAFLSTLPELKRQPNLLFAAVKYLAGCRRTMEPSTTSSSDTWMNFAS